MLDDLPKLEEMIKADYGILRGLIATRPLLAVALTAMLFFAIGGLVY